MATSGEGNVAEKAQEWIGRLYRLIDAYEGSPAALDGAEFMRLYESSERAIELAGEQEAQAFALDQALFNAVSIADTDASDLRLVVSHALTIHHRYHADYGRGFEQAYRWCEKSRQRQMPDLRFLHTYVLPPLLKKAAFGGNLELGLFLCERLARFENLEKVPVWDDEKAADLLKQEPGELCYQLARRRVKYPGENLTRVPNSLEQRLAKDGVFPRLRKDNLESTPLLSYQIERYEYDKGETWWTRFKAGAQKLWAGMVERMAGEYIAYELTRRKGAYIAQALLMVAILLGLAMGLFFWGHQNRGRLTDMEADLQKAAGMIDADLQQLHSGSPGQPAGSGQEG
jgi:hypothetical protein